MRFASTLALMAAALLSLLALGCSSEDHYCDETACYYCDGVGCREVDPPPRPACLGDFECAAGTHCTDLGCVASCSADSDCPAGSECRLSECLHPAEVALPTPGSCERNLDCAASGIVCRDGMCAYDDRSCGELGCDCSATGACSAGFVCATAECVPEADLCHFSHECGPGRSCVDGACVSGCVTGAECVIGQVCTAGFCEDAPLMTGECASDAECGPGGLCIDSSCFEGCTEDAECGADRYCAAGVCAVDTRPRPFCASDADCEPGHPCVGGICRTSCGTHDDCLRFDVQYNYCLDSLCVTTNEATTDCALSADCGAGRACIDGICR